MSSSTDRVKALREVASVFREMNPSQIAENILEYVESMSTDDDAETTFCLVNLVRAADLLQRIGEGKTLVALSDEFAAMLKTVADIFDEPMAEVLEDRSSFIFENLTTDRTWSGDWSFVSECIYWTKKRDAEAFARRLRAFLEPCNVDVVPNSDGVGWGYSIYPLSMRSDGTTIETGTPEEVAP